MISDFFNVYVGLVSGKDNVFRSDQYGNMTILKDKDKRENFIFIDSFPTELIGLNEYLLSHKAELMDRKIIKMTEENWYKWGAPRNITAIKNNLGKPCIYVKTLTRSDEIAFIGKVEPFGGNLLLLLPKKDICIQNIIDTLNDSDFRNQHTYSGRFKITHRQLSHVLLN
jgi:adenine-specific DNA-methyltransferase